MIPSLFIAHGAPLLAIEDNEYTQFLENLGRTLPRPKAIVMFSAHWVSPIQMVGQVDEYSTIYDFGGFPEALYRIQYPAKGSEQLAKEIEELFSENGVSYRSRYKSWIGSWSMGCPSEALSECRYSCYFDVSQSKSFTRRTI